MPFQRPVALRNRHYFRIADDSFPALRIGDAPPNCTFMAISASVAASVTSRKIGPQTGMTAEPCAGMRGPAVIAPSTFISGNWPLFRAASVVKSDGVVFNALAAGPSPLPEGPWQEAQCARNNSFAVC